MKLSVVICTHNPSVDYFRRSLEALRQQTHSSEDWELMVVDNGSTPAVAGRFDLSWHPRSRFVREDNLGLTHARLRGIAEARGQLIVFVDDDNVLEKNYLAETARIGEDFPFLGAWGGSTIGEYEIEPPPWFWCRESFVGVRVIPRSEWSNQTDDFRTSPIGAGMTVRAAIARAYAEKCQGNAEGLSLDRKGEHLLGSGDLDLAYTACDLGYGKGVFASLKLTHLISEKRVSLGYMLRLVEGTAYSSVVLHALRGEPLPKGPRRLSWRQRLLETYLTRNCSKEHRAIDRAQERGLRRGLEHVSEVASRKIGGVHTDRQAYLTVTDDSTMQPQGA
jgi:glycosyltransferase involved in cell wall biosynthesis